MAPKGKSAPKPDLINDSGSILSTREGKKAADASYSNDTNTAYEGVSTVDHDKTNNSGVTKRKKPSPLSWARG